MSEKPKNEHQPSIKRRIETQDVSSDKTDPLWLIGSDPVDLGVVDASVNHDEYLYGPLSESVKA